jgi:hypothetical protein
MNNTTTTKGNLSLVAILMAATLVIGTFATTTTIGTTQQSTAFAYSQKKKGDDNNSRNGNTITALKCQNRGSASGFDTTLDQECENLICTHPGNNATCVQEGAASQAQVNKTQPVTLTCEECFTKFLTPGQITIVVSSEAGLADLCLSLEQGRISETALIRQLNVAGVSETIQAQLIQCLIDAGLPFEPLIV